MCVRPEFSWRSGLAPRCLDPANYASRWCSSRLIGVIPEPCPPGLLISVLLFLFFFLHFSSKCLSSSYPWGHPPHTRATPPIAWPRPQTTGHAPIPVFLHGCLLSVLDSPPRCSSALQPSTGRPGACAAAAKDRSRLHTHTYTHTQTRLLVPPQSVTPAHPGRFPAFSVEER